MVNLERIQGNSVQFKVENSFIEAIHSKDKSLKNAGDQRVSAYGLHQGPLLMTQTDVIK